MKPDQPPAALVLDYPAARRNLVGLYSVTFTTRRTGDDTEDAKAMITSVMSEFPKADPIALCEWFSNAQPWELLKQPMP